MGIRKSRRNRRRPRFSRRRKMYKQRGGDLKEDALKILADNNITDLDKFLFESGKFVLNEKGNAYNSIIFGDYTFIKTRDMSRTYYLKVFKTSEPDTIVELYRLNDY